MGMNLKKIYDIYNAIKERIPSTYPRPKLAFFEDEECMLINNKLKRKSDESVYAIVNPETYTINLPLSMTFEYGGPSGTFNKSVPINKSSVQDIAHTILHEIAHLYFGERYGYESDQYSDEKACDRFADRWLKKLEEEQLI